MIKIVSTLRLASLDVWLLWFSISLRMFGFGLTNQVLVLFLQSIEISELKIGWFMTLTLVGDVLISYFLSWNADLIGRRRVLIAGTLMMIASGGIFAYLSNYLLLLVSAIVGVISPSGDETGPFKTIEEASIAHLTPHEHRPEVFAFHGLYGTFGNALGSLFCGIIIDYLNLTLQWDLLSCYRVIFIMYTFIGIIKFFIMISLSKNCEVDDLDLSDDDDFVEDNDETTPLTGNQRNVEAIDAGSTWNVASRLLVVFFLDSLGYGFMPASWVVYYFKVVFEISASLLGTLFFITSIVNVGTTLPSAVLAKLLGPVKAIIAVQAPSVIFFMLIPFMKRFFPSAVLLVLYYATTTMDVVPRQILLTSVVKKEDLTKVMGTVNTVKTFARCVGPVFVGKLAEIDKLSFGFFISGIFTLLADVVLGISFVNLDSKILQKQRLST